MEGGATSLSVLVNVVEVPKQPIEALRFQGLCPLNISGSRVIKRGTTT